MSWYNTTGPCQNYVLFSKVRYTRNIAKQNFYHLIDQKRSEDVRIKLDMLLQSNGFRCEKLLPGVSVSMLSLAEKQFLERDIIYSDKPRALYLNEPCNLLVAYGGDNYLTVTSIVAGLSIEEAGNMASGAERLCDGEIPFAYNGKLGYLTPMIRECGSGITFSSALYLPSLRLYGDAGIFTASSLQNDMHLTKMFCDGDKNGDLYILTHTPHYLSSEESSMRYFTDTVSHICDREKARLDAMLKGCKADVKNSALRAYGMLRFSESLSEREMRALISDIRLYHCIATDTSSRISSIQALNFLSAEGLNASVAASQKEGCTSQEECDIARALFVSRYIQHKNEEK